MKRPPRPERRRARGLAGAALPLVAALALAGCVSLSPGPNVSVSPVAPARPAALVPQDPQSAELAAYYLAIQNDRLSRGLMRTDSGADEAPTTARRLAEDYIEVALHEEHVRGPLGFGGRATSHLRRWQVPVVYSLEFGDSVGHQTRLRDHQQVVRLAHRLAQASGHPISVAPLGSRQGNFHVLVLSERERRAAGPRLRALVPGIDDEAVRLITNLPRATYCLVMAFSRDGGSVYSEAVAIIRAEHPDLTRLSCYHEELTQGLGLASDSDDVRPSIFNDDQEFALITDHDLLLLKLHYDPRLTPGMTVTEARPIIFSIASELAPGET